jgi:hypothetical protein
MIIALTSTIGGTFLPVILDLLKIGFYFDKIKNDIHARTKQTEKVFYKGLSCF